MGDDTLSTEQTSLPGSLSAQLREDAAKLFMLAKEVLTEESLGEVSGFVSRIEPYLEKFDHWKDQVLALQSSSGEGIPQVELNEFRRVVVELEEIHAELIRVAHERVREVQDQFSDAQNRTHALKAYLGKLPERVTIAGTRKG